MSIPILVEPTPTGFRAETGSPLNLSAVGPSSQDAIAALQAKIAFRLQNGAMIVELPLPPSPPIPIPSLADNPLVDQWLAAVAEYRNQRDAEDRALYQDGP